MAKKKAADLSGKSGSEEDEGVDKSESLLLDSDIFEALYMDGEPLELAGYN